MRQSLSTGLTDTQCIPSWESADSFVDRQISRERLHVWPFAASYPVDVRFLVLDRRANIPLHRPDHLEIVVFESGRLGYEVGQRRCVVETNDIIVVSNHVHHRCLPLSPAQSEARNVVLSFLPETLHLGSPVGDDFQYLMPFSVYGSVVPNVIPARRGFTREMLDLIDRVRQEIPRGTEASRLAIRTYLKMILLILVQHSSEFSEARLAFRRKAEARDRLSPIFQHLHRHYDERISVNDAARLCAVSPCSFVNLFREVTGQSFVAYLNGFRVVKAQGLLASTSRTIADVSVEAGFCSQSYFGMVFRRLTGMTPLDYRLQCSGEPGKTHTAVNPPSTVKMPPMQ